MDNTLDNSYNIGFIIQARVQSTRLPKKVLLPMPINNGKPIIQWIVDQLKNSKLHAKTIIATSKNPDDDILESYCLDHSLNYYRGDECNVLSRFISITQLYNFDHIVRLTGDNPIIDAKILDQFVLYHISNNFDYTKTKGLPLGMNFEVISSKALLSLQTKELTDYDKEHVTHYVLNSDKYSKGLVHYKKLRKMKDLRLTVDYPSDYTLMSALLSLYGHNKKQGLEYVEHVYNKFPFIFKTNINNYQKKKYYSLPREISDAKKVLLNHGFDKVVTLLEKKSPKQETIHH